MAISPLTRGKSAALIDSRSLGFEILRDAGNEVAHAFGLRFQVPEDLKEVYRGFGIDLAAANGEDGWTLPMPARYVVATDGTVRYARVHPDYTRRPEPSETVAALRATC